MRSLIYFSLISCLAIIACQKPDANSSSTAERYQLKGKIVSVNRIAKTATIEHEAIEGYMSAMTMDFPIHADWAWDVLKPGAEVRADLVVDKNAKEPFYLEKLGIIAAADPNNPVATNPNFAQIGQPVPDFTLTNQDGKKISIKDFKGKALAITFIYAKCPLPDYCIRMSTNFSDLARHVSADPQAREKVRLLSISFDPENDTPAKLRSYGIGYLGNDPNTKFDVWQLAVGTDDQVRKIADFFGLQYQRDTNDKTLINHSLRTAVIAPDGKVVKIFPGNEWTPAELLKELQTAADQ